MSSLSLHQRINTVRRENPYIKKEKQVESYMAVTHDQVTAELRGDLIKNGVLVFPSLVPGTMKTVPTGTFTSRETPLIRLEAEIAVHFVCTDDPKDREVIIIPAHAIDHGDKAPGKLLSYAVKYALLKMFNIETGEDDEGRVEQYQEPTADPEFKKILEAAATQGTKKLKEVWEKGTPALRKSCATLIETLKSEAKDVDKNIAAGKK